MSESTPQTPQNDIPASSTTSRGVGGQDRVAVVLLLLACLLGLLRFWKLGDWSLWIDEAYTFADGSSSPWEGQVWNPLGYQLILWTVDLVGGRADEFSLRLLPAIVGWLCVPLSFWAFRGRIGDRSAALVALLLAVSSWHIYWSQNARFYTFAMAASLLGGGIYLRGMWGGRPLVAMLGILLSVIGAAFHVTAALVVPALCLAPFLPRMRKAAVPPGFWRAWRVILIVALLGGLLATPWLLGALSKHMEDKLTADALRGPAHLMLTSGYFYTPLLGIAAVIGAFWAWIRRDGPTLLAVAVVLLTLGGTLVISTRVLMTAQYTFCLLPWVFFVAVAPLESLGRCRKGQALFWGGAAVLAAPALAGTLLYLTVRQGERPRWRDAYTWVDSAREDGDLILGMGAPIGEFYLGAHSPDLRRTRTVSPLGDWFPEGPRRWNRHDRRIWVVIRPQWLPSLNPDDRLTLESWLASDCRLVKSFPVLMEGRDLELRVYLRG
jgi:mannosyltransferase